MLEQRVSPPKSPPLNKGHISTPSTQRGWFHTLAANLPGYTFTTANPSRDVHYLKKRDESSSHSLRVRKTGVSVVGFDLEWKPMRDGFREYNKVSLVQVATPEEILLIQLPEFSKFPMGLRALLEDSTILKVGAGIQNDVDKLKRDWKVDVKNFLDLAFVARYHDYFWDTCDVLSSQCLEGAFGGTWCNEAECDVSSTESITHKPLEHQYGRPVYPTAQPVALARLVARYLGKRLDKECQLSNWAAPLNEKQIQYAANDGFSSLDVYNALVRLRDRTPGWIEAQATFYRLLIESQRFSVPISSFQSMAIQQPTPEEDEPVFTMDPDETVEPSVGILDILKYRQPKVQAPTLHRSLSDTNVFKSFSHVKEDKMEVPLYPSPPVTPTNLPLSPASPSVVSKSAPASPISVTRSFGDMEEPGKVESTRHEPVFIRQRPTLVQTKASKHSVKPSASKVVPAHALPARPSPSIPTPTSYSCSLPTPTRVPPSHRPSASYSVTPVEYLPPTPATPYPYEGVAPVYHFPLPYTAAQAYPYPTAAVGYSTPAYGYAPYFPPQAQPQPYYTWNSPPAVNHWIGPTTAPAPVMHTPVPEIPTEPIQKRPSLRYTPDGWCNVDSGEDTNADVVPTRTSKKPSNGWVKPMPDGVPIPLLEGALVPAAAPNPQTLFIGDVALDSDLHSENVRFGSVSPGRAGSPPRLHV